MKSLTEACQPKYTERTTTYWGNPMFRVHCKVTEADIRKSFFKKLKIYESRGFKEVTLNLSFRVSIDDLTQHKIPILKNH